MINKKIAILGGGITGLTAAYYASQKGYNTTLFEKSHTLGGLAQGFKENHWEWPLERAYHHLFKNDSGIINFAQEVGFNDIYFSTPKTDSLYKVDNNYRIFPVDSPQDFLRFPLLNMRQKIQAAAILGGLKILPALKLYEEQTAEEYVKAYMGKRVWEVFFEQLFRKKFGKYAKNVLASFLWARIHKRTRELGYIKGGFQSFVDYLEGVIARNGVVVLKGVDVDSITQRSGGFLVNNEEHDYIISTLPTPIMTKLGKDLFPKDYIEGLTKLSYLHALVLILETSQPILDSTYWLNICAEEIPMMFIGQHTNFVDKKHYGGNHIAYIGYYLERDDPKMSMTTEQLINFLSPHLKKIAQQPYTVLKSYLYKGPFAQPIFDKTFLRNKPDFITPVENFFIANLDMTYPYDRGTNYAVQLGKKVVSYLSSLR